MPNLVADLDHTGLGIKDLESARRAFERLGFTLTPRSMHAGAVTPGGPVVPWGSGNHCAMFKRGYFELIGLVDDTMPSSVKRMVERYEGLHIVAIGCDSADQTHAGLIAAGINAAAPAALERDAAFGPNNDQTRRAKFRNIHLDADSYPEARFIIIEHCTRDVLWQPHLTDHPNGAEELAAVYFSSPDVDATLARLTPLLGAPVRHADAHLFSLARGKFWVLSEEALRARLPVFEHSPINRVAAACIKVKSLEALASYFDERGVAYQAGPCLDSNDNAIWVGADEASHGVLQFISSH